MAERPITKVALVGCGFVADYYMETLQDYPWIEVAGVHDLDGGRSAAFAAFYGLKVFASLEELLADASISIVVNLTNPRAHFEVSRRCLEAGRHVYSEKPLAMELEQAQALVSLAERKGLQLSCAPCSLHSQAAQSLWHAVHHQVVGKVRLVYAELDDGMVSRMPYRLWKSRSGTPWPYRDEFEVGCTLEHAGYYLTWLLAIFGPVRSLTSQALCLQPDKCPGEALSPPDTPDSSFGILQFANGVVVRLSTTIIAPHDRSIRVIGDEGVMHLADCWRNDAKVKVRKYLRIRRRVLLTPWSTTHRAPGAWKRRLRKTGSSRMDFAAGIADLIEAVRTRRDPLLGARFSLHVTEVALALQRSGEPLPYRPQSSFEPLTPSWREG